MTGLGPFQPSPVCPPLAAQLAAFDDDQVNVIDWPTVTVLGDADRVEVGRVSVTATVPDALTPFAAQLNE